MMATRARRSERRETQLEMFTRGTPTEKVRHIRALRKVANDETRTPADRAEAQRRINAYWAEYWGEA